MFIGTIFHCVMYQDYGILPKNPLILQLFKNNWKDFLDFSDCQIFHLTENVHISQKYQVTLVSSLVDRSLLNNGKLKTWNNIDFT